MAKVPGSRYAKHLRACMNLRSRYTCRRKCQSCLDWTWIVNTMPTKPAVNSETPRERGPTSLSCSAVFLTWNLPAIEASLVQWSCIVMLCHAHIVVEALFVRAQMTLYYPLKGLASKDQSCKGSPQWFRGVEIAQPPHCPYPKFSAQMTSYNVENDCLYALPEWIVAFANWLKRIWKSMKLRCNGFNLLRQCSCSSKVSRIRLKVPNIGSMQRSDLPLAFSKLSLFWDSKLEAFRVDLTWTSLLRICGRGWYEEGLFKFEPRYALCCSGKVAPWFLPWEICNFILRLKEQPYVWYFCYVACIRKSTISTMARTVQDLILLY